MMADEDLGLGTDWAVETDLEERVRLATGRDNLSLAVVRRLGTPRGGLFYDPDYGLDLRTWLGSDFDLVVLQNMGSQIEDEVLKDERLQAATATVTYDLGTEALTIDLGLEDALGPFELILRVDQVSVSILRGGRVQTTAPVVAVTAPTVVVAAAGSGVGQRGPAGPPGTSATSSFELAVDDDGEHYVIGTSEIVVSAFLVNLAGAPTNLVASLTCAAMVSAGTGTLGIRIGGTENGIDGTLVATGTVTATAFGAKLVSGTLPNPGGQVWVKATAYAGGGSDLVYVRRPAIIVKE